MHKANNDQNNKIIMISISNNSIPRTKDMHDPDTKAKDKRGYGILRLKERPI